MGTKVRYLDDNAVNLFSINRQGVLGEIYGTTCQLEILVTHNSMNDWVGAVLSDLVSELARESIKQSVNQSIGKSLSQLDYKLHS